MSLRIAAIVVASLGILAACGGGGGERDGMLTGTPDSSIATASPEADASAEPPNSPASAVRAFYRALDDADLVGAYALLSDRLQSTQPYDSWASGYDTTAGLKLLELRTEAEDTVYVRVQAIDLDGAEALVRVFEGTWKLTRHEGRLRLDTGSLQEVERELFTRPSLGSAVGFFAGPDSISPPIADMIGEQCESSGSESRLITGALEEMGQSAFDIWEYAKGAELQNLANLQWWAACGARAPTANPGFFLTIPPLSLVDQIQNDSFRSEDCRALAEEMEALYAFITEDIVKGRVYFEIMPDIAPLRDEWETQCEP